MSNVCQKLMDVLSGYGYSKLAGDGNTIMIRSSSGVTAKLKSKGNIIEFEEGDIPTLRSIITIISNLPGFEISPGDSIWFPWKIYVAESTVTNYLAVKAVLLNEEDVPGVPKMDGSGRGIRANMGRGGCPVANSKGLEQKDSSTVTDDGDSIPGVPKRDGTGRGTRANQGRGGCPVPNGKGLKQKDRPDVIAVVVDDEATPGVPKMDGSGRGAQANIGRGGCSVPTRKGLRRNR